MSRFWYHMFWSVPVMFSRSVAGRVVCSVVDLFSVPVDICDVTKGLSLSSNTIFSAIFFPIPLIDSIVFLSSFCKASMSLCFPSESICKATFQPTPDIFMSSVNNCFSWRVVKPKRDCPHSVI